MNNDFRSIRSRLFLGQGWNGRQQTGCRTVGPMSRVIWISHVHKSTSKNWTLMMGKIMPNFLQRSPKYEPQPRKWERGLGSLRMLFWKKNPIGEDKLLQKKSSLMMQCVAKFLTGHTHRRSVLHFCELPVVFRQNDGHPKRGGSRVTQTMQIGCKRVINTEHHKKGFPGCSC